MINAHNYTKAICSKASQLGITLRFERHHHGYSWQWNAGGWFPIIGWADPADKVCALSLACEDLAKAMGWQYSE